MTVPINVYRRPDLDSEVLTLARFVAGLDGGTSEIVTAPRGLDHPVRAMMIWDSADCGGIESGTVVLGVGVDAESPQLVSLIETAGRAGATAVMIKSPLSLEWVRAVADRVGIAVLGVPRNLGWDMVHQAVRTTIAAGRASLREVVERPAGDLFESRQRRGFGPRRCRRDRRRRAERHRVLQPARRC